MGGLSIILIVLCLIVMFALQNKFKEQTGVDMPSRSAWRGVKRRARKRGISDQEALDKWIANKQRRNS